MPGRVFFRDDGARVTSTELLIGTESFPLADILEARAAKRQVFLFFHRYILVIITASGAREVLRHRNAYLVFQLVKALETALRESKRNHTRPTARIASPTASQATLPAQPLPSMRLGR